MPKIHNFEYEKITVGVNSRKYKICLYQTIISDVDRVLMPLERHDINASFNQNVENYKQAFRKNIERVTT